MGNRHHDILDAAVQVFSRYGVGRTRMGDIASEAGIARQTLYGTFKNKDEILSAAILHFSDMALEALQADWREGGSVQDLIESYHRRAILPSFGIMTASPDARDMINGFNDVGRAATRVAEGHKIAALQEALFMHPDAAGVSKEAVAQVAEYVVLASLGCRDLAEDLSQLERLLETLRESVVAKIKLENRNPR